MITVKIGWPYIYTYKHILLDYKGLMYVHMMISICIHGSIFIKIYTCTCNMYLTKSGQNIGLWIFCDHVKDMGKSCVPPKF